jgi:hypothetical protein
LSEFQRNFKKEGKMEKIFNRILSVVTFALMSGMVLYNGIVLIVANEECPNTAAGTGACTSCDVDYAGTTPDCSEESECVGSGYSVVNDGLGVTSSTGTIAISGAERPCLWASECRLGDKEDGTKGCYAYENALSSGVFYLTWSCDDYFSFPPAQ